MNNSNGSIYYSLNLDLNQLRADANKSTAIFKSIGDSAISEGIRIDAVFKKIGGAAAGIFTFQKAVEFTKSIISVRGEIQNLAIAFETMLGSKSKSDKMMSDIMDMAKSTPFTLTDVASNTKQLIAMGIEADKVIDTMQALGDVAAGVSVPISRIAVNYGQVAALGKLQTREIRDFAMAGIPIVDELSKMLGKSSAEISELVEAGKIGFPLVEQAFKNMSGEGGRFYNLMEKQNASVTGQISKLQDELELMFNKIGESNQGLIYDAIGAASSLVENYEKVGKEIAALVTAYGAYKAAIIAVSVVENYRATRVIPDLAMQSLGFANATKTLTFAQWGLAKAQSAVSASSLVNTYILAAAAVAGLAYGIYKLTTYQTDAEKAQNRLNDAMKEAEKAAMSEHRELARLKGELSATKKGTEDYDRIRDQIVSKFGQYYQNLKDEIDTVGLLDSTYKSLTDSIQKSFGARQYEKFAQQESDNLDQILSDNLGKLQDRLTKDLGDELGAKYYTEIRRALLEGTELTQDVIDTINRIQDKGTIMADARVDKYINNIKEAQRIYDKTNKESRLKFGIDDIEATTESTSSSSQGKEKEIKGFASQVEDARGKVVNLKKELSDLRGGKIESDDYAKSIEEKAKELKEAEDKLSYLLTGKPLERGKSGSKDDTAQLKIAAAERLRAEQDYAEKLKVQAKRTGLEIEQARIEGMDEGLEKELAQINLIYDKLIFENEQRQAQMIKEMQDIAEVQWNQENSKAREKGETFDRSTVSEKSLTDSQLAQLKAYERVANEYRTKANKESLEDMLSDVQTYEQQRLKIAEDFEKKRKDLYKEDGSLRDGVTQGNVDELDYAENEAITAVDEEFAQREDTFEAWMNAIAEMSLNQLISTLQQAEAELAKLEQSGATGGAVALARTKVNEAKDKIAKTNAANSVSPGKKEIKDWQELQDAIHSADSELGEIEDTMDGTAKDIIKTARQIGSNATKIIDGIVLLANSAIAGAQTTAIGAAAAIATVEKASVILAIISAALMIVTQMFALFSKKDVMAEFNNELANLNDELERAKLAARIGNDERESIFGEDSWKTAIDNINAASEALVRYNQTLEDIKNIKKYPWMSDDLAKRLGFDNKNSSAEEAIKNMQLQVQHSTWFRSAKYQSLGNLPGLFENGELSMTALKEFADSDMFEKLSGDNQKLINDMIADWELYQEALNEVKDYLSDIFGDLGATMTDALVDAFANGTDAAQAFTDSVTEMLEKIAKQIVYSVTLAPLAKKAEEDMLEVMKNTGLSDEEKYAQMTGVIDDFVDGAIERQGMANDLMKKIQDSAAEKGYDIFKVEEDARESVAKGIASMSQDSADELNGRFTAIQYMTFEINNNVKLLTENSAQSLRHLAGIETNTGRLEAIENAMVSMNRTLGDIQLKGVKII